MYKLYSTILKMKILIIGSNGFIGSAGVMYFLSKNIYQVYGCDIAQAKTKTLPFFQVTKYNPDYDHIFKKEQFDICINASGSASVPESINDPENDFKLNVANMSILLESIRKYNPYCKLIQLSSAAVYGNPQTKPINELHPTDPISPYGRNKLESEKLCAKYNSTYHIAICCLRIFSAYGPGLKKQLFWDIYQKAQKSKYMELYGTGYESRDFIYIEDLISAIELVIINARFEGEIVNVANGEEILIKDAVGFFLKAMKWNGEYMFSGKTREGDPINWCSDITKLNNMGYQKKVDIVSGLNKYINWLL